MRWMVKSARRRSTSSGRRGGGRRRRKGGTCRRGACWPTDRSSPCTAGTTSRPPASRRNPWPGELDSFSSLCWPAALRGGEEAYRIGFAGAWWFCSALWAKPKPGPLVSHESLPPLFFLFSLSIYTHTIKIHNN